jgi:hypothetical protein
LGEKESLVFDKESYRIKLSKLAKLYARVDYLVEHLKVYYSSINNSMFAEQMNAIKENIDSILLSLQEITYSDLDAYEAKINDVMGKLQEYYFGNKNVIDDVFTKYDTG